MVDSVPKTNKNLLINMGFSFASIQTYRALSNKLPYVGILKNKTLSEILK
jgi:hypothetical protein